ncbi:hypothetical protein BN2537_5859 [Streptomyces venezuelae]|nr:hypothetical protein BN2537_5859 [Streptomyces venezuelae]
MLSEQGPGLWTVSGAVVPPGTAERETCCGSGPRPPARPSPEKARGVAPVPERAQNCSGRLLRQLRRLPEEWWSLMGTLRTAPQRGRVQT